MYDIPLPPPPRLKTQIGGKLHDLPISKLKRLDTCVPRVQSIRPLFRDGNTPCNTTVQNHVLRPFAIENQALSSDPARQPRFCIHDSSGQSNSHRLRRSPR